MMGFWNAVAAAGPYANNCTSLQTENHTNTSSLNFYRPDGLPDAQPTVSKHSLVHEIHEATSMQHRTFLGIFSVSRQTRQCSNEC